MVFSLQSLSDSCCAERQARADAVRALTLGNSSGVLLRNEKHLQHLKEHKIIIYIANFILYILYIYINKMCNIYFHFMFFQILQIFHKNITNFSTVHNTELRIHKS